MQGITGIFNAETIFSLTRLIEEPQSTRAWSRREYRSSLTFKYNKRETEGVSNSSAVTFKETAAGKLLRVGAAIGSEMGTFLR
jgi:hypothetical protein